MPDVRPPGWALKVLGRKINMDSIESLTNLASARRSKLFALLGEDIGAVISCDLPTKNYLSGYYSMNDT